MSIQSISGLRFRLALKQTLPFALLVSLLAWTAYSLVARHIYNVVDDEVQDRSIAVRSMLQIRRNSVTWLKEQADPEVRERFEKSVRYYQLLDRQGKVVESSGELSAFTLPLSTTARQSLESGRPSYETLPSNTGGRVRVYNSLVEGQQHTQYLMRVGLSLDDVDETCRNIALFIIAVFPVVIILQAGSSWLTARNALRPLEQINAAAKEISLDHPDRRLPLTGKGDELEQLSTTLNAMIAGFQASFQQTSEFLRNLSHELRQPLTVLRAETEQALRMGNLGEDYRKMLSKQLEHVELLSRTVSCLLASAQAEFSEIRLHRQTEDLYELVKAAVDGMSVSAGERGIQIIGNLQPEVMGEFDAGQLWRLLLNLLDNAIKFTPSPGRIDVSLTSDHEFATIMVRDTGCGISPDDLPRIFDRNFRASSAIKSGIAGTGLGLHFAKSIAESHGGCLEVASKVGEGSCFRVILPLHAYHGADLVPEQHPSQSIN
ncbi:MAG: HAMP domain-containing protein [Acidobacteriia bacterium]|nr:HAMP domain-containing protein [Terriglobia bacterium]